MLYLLENKIQDKLFIFIFNDYYLGQKILSSYIFY